MIVGVVRGNGALQSTESALEEALRLGNVDGIPYLVLRDILTDRDVQAPSASQISSTTWRRAILERHVPYYVVPADRIAMYRGTLIHAGFEKSTPPPEVRVIKEMRLSTMLNGYELTGQEDLYWPDYKRLEDWKTVYKIPDLIKDDHVVQLAVYTWLLRWNDYPVESARINYVSWYEMVQRQACLMPDGSVSDVINHPLLADEDEFLGYIDLAFYILNMGYTNKMVPSMQYCTLDYCRTCPVKWACDTLPEGTSTQPDLDKLNQKDYNA